jgi:hypothetical protein
MDEDKSTRIAEDGKILCYSRRGTLQSLYGRIEALIIKGQTPILGQNGACSILKNEFLVEHPLFSRRLDFFRFKQGYGQSMSDAMADLRKLGDQATLDETDLYIMR